jgi:biofilm protein TabA
MISGTLSEWKNLKSYLPEVFSRAFAYLAAHGGDLETGRHEIEGSAFYVNVEEGMTRPASDRKFEAHARYIDIQLLLEGDERTDNTFPFFSGDFVEFLFFQVILVDMVAQ